MTFSVYHLYTQEKGDFTYYQYENREREIMYQIRDEKGRVFNEVLVPTAVYDSRDSVLLKIGEKEDMESFFEEVQNRYRAFGFQQEADDICLMELPKEQAEIDKVFQICDYIGVLHKKAFIH
jgi:hypothetical protein